MAAAATTHTQGNYRRFLTAYLYLVPAMLVMGIITYYPMAYNIWMSFTNYALKNLRVDAPSPDIVGWQNYSDIFWGYVAVPNFDFWRTLSFNLWWTFTNVPIHVGLGILIAVLLNTEGLWFKGFYRALYVLPIIIPTLVVGTVWRNMFDSDYGLINQTLIALGGLFGMAADPFKIRWLQQVDNALPFIPLPPSYYALLITNIWLGWPFMTIVATGALQSINKEYYEAASMDGATGVQQFWNITLPLLRPAMVPAAMYGIITTFNLFNLIFFISQGGPLRKTEILVTQVFGLVNGLQLYGVAAAFAVYIMIILIILTLLTNRITRATEAYDA